MSDLLLLAAGLAVLVAAAELLVRGATRLADILHVQPLLIGLTVVAFGTSAPEVSVSVIAARSGATAMAVGNVVGSNIFNVLMVLGVAALVAPLTCSKRVVRREVPVMVAASALALAIGLSGRIDRAVGAGLLALGVIYVGWLVHAERREQAAGARGQPAAPAAPAKRRAADTVLLVALQLLLIAGGLVGLVAGARWMVESASRIAGRLGVSDLLVGLTVIAAGTSLPELATSVVASRRGARDLAVGNVVGSNIFNLLVVLGATSVAGAGPLPIGVETATVHLPIMLMAAVACIPLGASRNRISRWEGALLVLGYAAYLTYVIVAAVAPARMPQPSVVVVSFGIVLLGAATLGLLRGRR